MKSYNKYFVGGTIVLLIAMIVAKWESDWFRILVVEVKKKQFDWMHQNIKVKTHSQLDVLLKSLNQVNYDQLPKTYVNASGLKEKAFNEYYRKSTYYALKETDLYRFIVGEIRVIDLVPKDSFLNQQVLGYGKQWPLILFLDPQVLHKLLDLELALEAQGFDSNALKINYSYRYPTLNKKIKGASRSQHLFGKALDLIILDINKDGICDEADKRVVLEILENQIIGDGGGIGKYPTTHVVHFDVRGTKARWDYHKSKN